MTLYNCTITIGKLFEAGSTDNSTGSQYVGPDAIPQLAEGMVPFKYLAVTDTEQGEQVMAALREAAKKPAPQLIAVLKDYARQGKLQFYTDSAADIYRTLRSVLSLPYTEKNFTRSWY